MLRTLIIAQDTREIRELQSGLARMGFVCSLVKNIPEELAKQTYDMLFVDMDGSSASTQTNLMLEQLRELRIIKHIPAVALISGEGLNHIGSNFEIDDFVVKPWDTAELVTRAKRVIKQTNNVQNGDLIRCGNLVIDMAKCEVSIDARLLALTFKEYELLKFLVKNKGRVFTREALLNEVWGYEYYGGDRTVDVHIRRLRSKLDDHDNNYIQTVRNIGYRFNNGE